jgi:hypothetical protein
LIVLLGGFGVAVLAGCSGGDGDSPFPEQRPDDLRLTFSQDGGMLPWSESIEVAGDGSVYEVWMDGVAVVFEYQPPSERLDGLWDEVRLGRFDLFEEVDEGEVMDAGLTSHWVRFGGFQHSLSWQVEGPSGPSTDHDPLGAMSGFADLESVPEASSRMVIEVGDGLYERWGTDLIFDLGDADFALGAERMSPVLEVAWSGEARDVRLVATIDEQPTEHVVRFEPGGLLVLDADASGALVIG